MQQILSTQMSTRRKKKNKGYYRLPVTIVSVVVCLIGAVSYIISSVNAHPTRSKAAPNEHVAVAETPESPRSNTIDAETPRYELPQLSVERRQQVIEHLAYTVSYNQDWHLPNWVAYELTNHETYGESSRTNKFLPDPLVDGDPVITKDYSNSGYDRGHMAPAGDMKWSEQAMKESFYMTNMCPQNHNNNAGDWKDLEELVRDIASTYGNVYICCGPIVTDITNTIGSVRKIVVPQSFYKVLLRQKKDGSWTSIGFVMPNAAGNCPLMTYMHSVNEIENLTGIDFFYNLPDSIEDLIETDYTISDWTIK